MGCFIGVFGWGCFFREGGGFFIALRFVRGEVPFLGGSGIVRLSRLIRTSVGYDGGRGPPGGRGFFFGGTAAVTCGSGALVFERGPRALAARWGVRVEGIGALFWGGPPRSVCRTPGRACGGEAPGQPCVRWMRLWVWCCFLGDEKGW